MVFRASGTTTEHPFQPTQAVGAQPIEKLQCDHLASRWPKALSGGENNVASRALMVQPDFYCWTNPYRHWMPPSGDSSVVFVGNAHHQHHPSLIVTQDAKTFNHSTRPFMSCNQAALCNKAPSKKLKPNRPTISSLNFQYLKSVSAVMRMPMIGNIDSSTHPNILMPFEVGHETI